MQTRKITPFITVITSSAPRDITTKGMVYAVETVLGGNRNDLLHGAPHTGLPPRSDVVIDRPNGSGINISW